MTSTDLDPATAGFDPERLRRVDRHFARYVDDGRLAGWALAVARRGRPVLESACGWRDLDAGEPMARDTVFRIYSMTKPVTAVAALQLYEEGRFDLADPVAKFLPEFAAPRVYVGGPPEQPTTRPAASEMAVWHLFTHTAGLTYGGNRVHPVDAMYLAAGFDLDPPDGLDLAGCCAVWAGLPLLFDPGTAWNYSVATDVLGRLVEVVAGASLEQVLAERVFTPLGMTDTGFSVPAVDLHRLARLYRAGPDGRLTPDDATGDRARRRPLAFTGGAGLVSTLVDYSRFTAMLLGGGAVDGVRLLGSRTVRYMLRNHLPGGVDVQTFGGALVADSRYAGVGHGLGVAVMVDPVAYRTVSSAGEAAWGGAASTAFLLDPAEELSIVFLTQLMPSGSYPIRTELRQLVYAALVD